MKIDMLFNALRVTFLCITSLAIVHAVSVPAAAQSLESALMPGALSTAHAKLEVECKNCHVVFERGAQMRLCMDCHKPVGSDIKAKTGFHGRLKSQECKQCHTEHKGREAKLVKLNESTFDHKQTDFQLKGKHLGKACASCHKPGIKHRETPTACISCHLKNDHHKGGMGKKCETCHNESSWKDAHFDHSTTKFPLINSHAKAKCADCHPDQRYAGTSTTCVSCHRDDDAHKGRNGARCENCHEETKWEDSSFQHSQTRFPLRDRHRGLKCDSCHKNSGAPEKVAMRCASCHLKDDPHKDSLGDKCERCHSERGWKNTRFDHNTDTKFPLKDKHKDAKCQDCHTDPGVQTKVPSNCFACHEKIDAEKGHKGRYGEKCETCHVPKGFKQTIFDHDRDTKFILVGKHREAKCDGCHKGNLYDSKPESICYNCHEKDDIHFKGYGNKCEECHIQESWRKTSKHDPNASYQLWLSKIMTPVK